MKYVVLARDVNDGCICGTYGVFKSKRNAKKRLDEVVNGSYYDQEYLVEEVDPMGSFANDMCEDED